MNELIDMISNYGVMVVIVALFIWDWVDNKKSVKKSLEEMSKANSNIATSLELLQKSNDKTETIVEEIQANVNEIREHTKQNLSISQDILINTKSK